ncbi:receptor-like protein EIX2 [Salvia hispanica]|uniref:receptor-like protein EIX2 n=1 Tax=Salvia hispanica TaxID=49212 RepID=UPI0020096687|nr:receptor-like protein EIX2 [Salvia hispanica]
MASSIRMVFSRHGEATNAANGTVVSVATPLAMLSPSRFMVNCKVMSCGFSGSIPPQLGNLTNLRTLDLSWNDFGGIPFPEFIGSMKQLQHLSLSGCNFSGSIPPQLGNLTNLRSLDLSGNYFGSIPPQLGNLTNLRTLDLRVNDFGGIPIPEFIGSMKQLQHLSLRGCNFFGSIPPQLGNLTNLRTLDLSWNDFGGIPIPEFIGSMKQLQDLSLSVCNFSGSIPPQFGNLTNLRTLDLSQNSLSSISPFMFGSVFGSLETLHLSDIFTGLMPSLRVFPSLIELDLSENNFTGSVPLSIGQLSKLQLLDLSHNSLEGIVPPSIGQLSELQFLDLSYNSLKGLISESHFIKLNKLYRLDLSFNPLFMLDNAPDWSPPFQLNYINLARCNVGQFPKWIHTQMNLFHLDLSRANITDEAPIWLWNMSSSLHYLYLYENQISGTVPIISSMSIWCMDLSYNQFSGRIPPFPVNASVVLLSGNMFSGSISSICKTHQKNLNYLDLSSNQLEGEVPNCWENMPNLEILNLPNNNFSGEIPFSLGGLPDLSTLRMHGNNLCGELPNSLRLSQRLRFIDVEGNKLTGEIPFWIGQLYELFFLNLRGNKLHGSIPSEICNLTNIQVLDLSINNLSWIIPDCFNNFTDFSREEDARQSEYPLGPIIFVGFQPIYLAPHIERFGYSSLHWKGKEREYWENILFLKLIDFSSNRLTGNIPKSFSTMRGLISLNLSRNSLTGHIIPDIGNMHMLDSLDLSHNQLLGKIPTSLAEIHTLGFLDLSNNNLSGKIPTGIQLQGFNASFYADNDGLCGNPLPICPEDSLRPSTTNSRENMNEKDNIFSFKQEVGISMGFGFIFGFWGVIGSFILKKSWRIAFFNFFDAAGDWFYVTIAVFVSKWRRS